MALGAQDSAINTTYLRFNFKLQFDAIDPHHVEPGEIAELTGKQHKHVLHDVRTMLIILGLGLAGFSADLPDKYGRKQKVFNLPKRDALILVSGYSVELLARKSGQSIRHT